MSKFDFDAFTGDYPVAVSKERYTEQEAIEIAKRELGVDKVTMFDGYVRWCFGTDPDTCGDFKDKANFAKVKHGEWKEEYPTSDNIVCSVCGGMWNVLDNCTETFDFCPHCGAKMDGGENS